MEQRIFQHCYRGVCLGPRNRCERRDYTRNLYLGHWLLHHSQYYRQRCSGPHQWYTVPVSRRYYLLYRCYVWRVLEQHQYCGANYYSISRHGNSSGGRCRCGKLHTQPSRGWMRNQLYCCCQSRPSAHYWQLGCVSRSYRYLARLNCGRLLDLIGYSHCYCRYHVWRYHRTLGWYCRYHRHFILVGLCGNKDSERECHLWYYFGHTCCLRRQYYTAIQYVGWRDME